MNRRALGALALPFAVCALQWLLWAYIDPYVWFLFFPATFFAAWLGGMWPGLAATGVSVALVWLVFLAPGATGAAHAPARYFAVLVFAAMGVAFAFFFEHLRRVQSRTDGRFEAAFEQAAVGVALAGLDGRLLRVNRRLCEIVGRDAPAVLASSDRDLTHPDDAQPGRDRIAEFVAGRGSSCSLEKRYLRPDGTSVWVNLSASLVRTPDGRPDHLLLVIEDIDARKLAERSLALIDARYRDLVQNANSAILQWTPDGTIAFINDFAARLFGWSAQEAVGRPVGILVPERSSGGADLTQLVQDIATHPERYRNFVNENVCRDGRRIVMSWTNRALRDDAGRVTGILAVGNDFDDRARDEAELRRRNDELERFNAASVGRELQMIELKRQVNALSAELGRPAPFDVSFAGADAEPTAEAGR